MGTLDVQQAMCQRLGNALIIVPRINGHGDKTVMGQAAGDGILADEDGLALTAATAVDAAAAVPGVEKMPTVPENSTSQPTGGVQEQLH